MTSSSTPFTEDITVLDLDHPGASDPDYRERRNMIALLAQQFLKDPEQAIPVVEYTLEEDKTWEAVLQKLKPLHEKSVSSIHLKAQKNLEIPEDHVPQLRELSNRLEKSQGFRLAPVQGLLDPRMFLSFLGKRMMFCTQYIRHASKPGYTPEPDIVHEVMGHVPAFTDQGMAEFSELLGKIAMKANARELEQLERLYWFTIEFGLIDEGGELKAFGAGLLSSIGELQHCFTDEVVRRPFNMREVLTCPYDYSKMQEKLFIIPSFEFLKKETMKQFGSILER